MQKSRLIDISVLLIVMSLLIVGCNGDQTRPIIDPSKKGDSFAYVIYEDKPMISLAKLADFYGFTYDYDDFEGIVTMIDGRNDYYLLQETPVIAKNGIFIANKDKPYVTTENEVFITFETLKNLLNYRSELDNQTMQATVFSSSDDNSEGLVKYTEFQQKFASLTAADLTEYLSFLNKPLAGAQVTARDSQMPGAPRDYRNGTHEGLDWYSGYTGIDVNRSTQVLSIAEGTVVRADHDYIEYTVSDRDKILNYAVTLPHTPQYILDGLRGRTVWVQYADGVMARYAHLDSIASEVIIGSTVNQGQVIGYVGNSGTSYGIDGNDLGLHLHLDLLIYNHLFWEHLSQQEIREVLENIFPR